MPRPRLHPRPQQPEGPPEPSVGFRAIKPAADTPELRQPTVRSRANISNACMTCKQRKRKCLGGQPCPGCAFADVECLYDEALDRRRKSHNDRARAESDFQRRLLHDLLAALKCDNSNNILDMIRAGVSLEELAAALDRFNVTETPIYSDAHSQHPPGPSSTSVRSTSDYYTHPPLGLPPISGGEGLDFHHQGTRVVETRRPTALPTFQELNASLANSMPSDTSA